ncbi:MAG TPA: energy-coupling factor transporter transmembrane component T [Candidatus Dormibacteraeota bacterium]|nr:energy-coupling factor transporter transmembrane component T [Candidatus Dormibacteraeota bacterium]
MPAAEAPGRPLGGVVARWPSPATRLALAVSGAGLGLAWGGWVAIAVALGGAILALVAGRGRRLALAGLGLLPVALSSLALNALLPAGAEGVGTALDALARLLAVTLPMTLLFAATPLADLLADLEARGLDRRAVFVLGAALAAVPRAQERAREVVEAQRARGLDTEGTWPRRLRGLLPLVGPLVIGSLIEIEERALALEVRAFAAPGRRTPLRRFPEGPLQRPARWALAGLLTAGVAARVALRLAGLAPPAWLRPW